MVLVFVFLKRKKEPIYIVLQGYLGNTLRSITSMKILADELKRPFKIDLGITREVDKKIVKILFPEYIDNAPKYITKQRPDVLNYNSWTTTHPIIEATFKNIPETSFGVGHIYAAKLETMSDEEFIKRKIKIYKNLKWPNFEFDDVSNMVGVHMRYSDNLLDVTKNGLNTPLDIFKDKLKTLETPFLLCSDNSEIIDYVKEEYPNTIFPDIQDDPDLQGLYEMILLSRTKYIVGSYASTFSYEASFFRGIPLEIYEKGKWKTYT